MFPRPYVSRIARAHPLRKSFLLAAALGALGASPLLAQVAPPAHAQAETLRKTGISEAANGRLDDAVANFRRALTLDPGNAALLEAIGAAYSMKGDLETARTYLAKSLELNPDSISTRQNLGITLFGLGRYDDAQQQFAAIQRIQGKPQAIANLFLGMIAQRRTDCDTAIPLLEASGDLLHQQPDALLSYAECQQHTGKIEAAAHTLLAFDQLPAKTPAQIRQAANLQKLLAPNPDREPGKAESSDGSSDVLQRAISLEKNNRLEQAQQLLKQKSDAQPSFDILLELAEVARKRSDFALAMKSLKRASEIDPSREDSYLEFSTICADHGNDQLALDTAEIGLENVPNSYRLTVQKGAVLEKLGHLGDAEETLRKAIGMQNDNSVARLSLAVVQAQGGRPEEAEHTLSEAIAQFPDDYYMHYFRAKLLLQSSSAGAGISDVHELARQSLERSIQLNPKYADSYYQLSLLYLPDSTELAEQALHRCLQLEPNHTAAQYSLARLYVRNGHRAEGEALLARLKAQKRTEDSEQQKQLRIEIAHD